MNEILCCCVLCCYNDMTCFVNESGMTSSLLYFNIKGKGEKGVSLCFIICFFY